MVSDRVKATKAYQVAGKVLPPMIWEDIAELAAANAVDLNCVREKSVDTYIIGCEPTKLTICANRSEAKLQ